MLKLFCPEGRQVRAMLKDVNDSKEPLFNKQNSHPKDEEKSAALPSRGEPVLSPNALAVLKKRYLSKEPNGDIETPSRMFRRVASNIASAELKYNPDYDINSLAKEFYKMMSSLEFLPNSPTLMNAGRELQQLSACFVLPVDDSMESIFDAVKNLAIIQKSGGGTGFSFSRLRPKNDKVATTGGVASGPISFMKVFNSATDVVKQGGTRRGANMAILEVTHPDILEFITVKSDMKELTNFNLSVAVTEDFMKAVEEGSDYDLINPRNGKPAGKLNARKVFDVMVENAWKSGEPGIIFIDRINRDNPTPELGRIESTNPCGEVPLLPMESCNLGSINLAKMVKSEGGRVEVNYEKLAQTVKLAVRFLDNVIDMNNYPLPQIEAMTMGNRKIGVGVMGFADMLIQMGVPYNSEKALEIAEEAMSFIQNKARETSAELAKEKVPFPNFIVSRFFKEGSPPLRNSTLTTVAPTGTLSIIAGCSSGIEPVFALSYIRQILDEEKFLEVHPIFEEMAKEKGFYSRELMENLSKKASIQNVKAIPEDARKIFITSHDVSPEWHVRMQAAFQKYTDNAVSKTVNFPKEASQEDVKKVFWLAYREGCKGITIYRYASRGKQVLNIEGEDSSEKPSGEKSEKKTGASKEKLHPRERPPVTMGTTEKVAIGCGNLYVTVNSDEVSLCEVFTQTGKGGGCDSQSEAVGRLASMALRSGIDPAAIIRQLKGIRCLSCIRRRGVEVLSCPDAVAKAIEKALKIKSLVFYSVNGNGADKDSGGNGNGLIVNGTSCPDCGSTVEFAGGCIVCRSCGYSKCG